MLLLMYTRTDLLLFVGGACNPRRPKTFSMVASATHRSEVFENLENPTGDFTAGDLYADL